MFNIALSVQACLRAGTAVDVAWLVDAGGLAQPRPEALAVTPGGGRIGTVLAGAADAQLVDRGAAGARGGGGRVVDLDISDLEASIAGLDRGGRVRCLLMPADALPGELWPLLIRRQPVCLVSRCDGDRVLATLLFTAATITDADPGALELFGRRRTAFSTDGDSVVSVLWPVPTLLAVGSGGIVDALAASAALLGWNAQSTTDQATATGVIASLAPIDAVVVAAHDVELAGACLAAALAGDVGYIGAVGGRRMQQARADWLAFRGVTDLARVHGPAGLDIGAESDQEIALSILAEALAVTRRPQAT